MTQQHRMLQDIVAQPASLAGVLEYQSGPGRAALERAANAIRSVPKVVITGMGASLNAAMPLAFQLNAAGRPAVLVEAGELLHFGGEIVRDAVVVLVSRSGETVEAVGLLDVLRGCGATVIGVTNEPGTTLANRADIPVLVNSGRDEAVAVQTYTGTALTLLLVSALIAGKDRWGEASGVADAVARAVADPESQAASWMEFVEGVAVVYVLGRGASLASAHEGALLFNETAKLASVCMPAGGFRHGPVEVVEKGFRAVLFASEPRTAGLDETLGSALVRMGGAVRTVKEMPGFFAPVTEIIPVQFAAYAAALSRGLTPGRFRYVSLVTTSETEFRIDAP